MKQSDGRKELQKRFDRGGSPDKMRRSGVAAAAGAQAPAQATCDRVAAPIEK